MARNIRHLGVCNNEAAFFPQAANAFYSLLILFPDGVEIQDEMPHYDAKKTSRNLRQIPPTPNCTC